MRNFKMNWLLMILISIIFSSCTHQQPKAPLISQNWADHKLKVDAIQYWQATGKLAVKVPNDGGNLNLKWLQTGDTYQIDLNGPFGSGKVTIQGLPNSVTMTEAGQPPQTAKTAEELIRKNSGWTIPVTQLAFWVRGLPDPNTKVSRFIPNAQGIIGELEQSGWKIIYGDYISLITATSIIPMPGRIVAEYKDVRLTLVVREWLSINPDAPPAQVTQ